jgi:hypothetical protein
MVARQLGRSNVEIIALSRLNTVARAMGRVAERLACFDRAIEVAEQTGNLRLVAAIRGNLGAAETRWGQFERAKALITGALETQRAIGDRASEGYSHWQMMTLHGLLGNGAAALRAGQQALAIAADVRDRGLESGALLSAVSVAVEFGEFDQAEQWLARYDGLAGPAGRVSEPTSLLPRAALAMARGQREPAAQAMLAWVNWLEQRGGTLYGYGAEGQDLWQACTALRSLSLQGPYERVLERAWRQLQHECAELPESRRAAFLHRVPYNRAVAEAWSALHPGPADLQ